MIAVSTILARMALGFGKTPQKPLTVAFFNRHPFRNQIVGFAVVQTALSFLVECPHPWVVESIIAQGPFQFNQNSYKTTFKKLIAGVRRRDEGFYRAVAKSFSPRAALLCAIKKGPRRSRSEPFGQI